MPSKDEKRRRAELVKEIVRQEKAIEKMPISPSDLAKLFDILDERLGVDWCDHTKKITSQFLESRNLNANEIFPWFEEYGGYCDCEILANVEESWGDEIENNT